MRILIANDTPLVRELGAAQCALGLAEGLRDLGHNVVLWSPEPVRRRRPFNRELTSKRRRLEEYTIAAGRFDLIDAPATLITERLASQALTVARAVQPELRYRWLEVVQSLRAKPLAASTVLNLLTSINTWSAHVGGWRRARRILCLGSLEAAWMTGRYPSWQDRIGSYNASLCRSDRTALQKIREKRSSEEPHGDPRFLWIGRWTHHKGPKHLQEWFARRAAAGVEPRLTIAGCGLDGRLNLPSLFRDNRRVEIVAEFKRSELPALLARHDAGLFTSAVEGWGLSLQEMLESGLPVFATRAGAVPDLETSLSPLLRPFPPVAPVPAGAQAQIDWTAYESRFNWSQIAREYEAFVTGGVAEVPPR